MLNLLWLLAVGACLWFGSTNGLLAILIVLVMDMGLTIYGIKRGLNTLAERLADIRDALMVDVGDPESVTAEQWGHIADAVKPALTPILFTRES